MISSRVTGRTVSKSHTYTVKKSLKKEVSLRSGGLNHRKQQKGSPQKYKRQTGIPQKDEAPEKLDYGIKSCSAMNATNVTLQFTDCESFVGRLPKCSLYSVYCESSTLNNNLEHRSRFLLHVTGHSQNLFGSPAYRCKEDLIGALPSGFVATGLSKSVCLTTQLLIGITSFEKYAADTSLHWPSCTTWWAWHSGWNRRVKIFPAQVPPWCSRAWSLGAWDGIAK